MARGVLDSAAFWPVLVHWRALRRVGRLVLYAHGEPGRIRLAALRVLCRLLVGKSLEVRVVGKHALYSTNPEAVRRIEAHPEAFNADLIRALAAFVSARHTEVIKYAKSGIIHRLAAKLLVRAALHGDDVRSIVATEDDRFEIYSGVATPLSASGRGPLRWRVAKLAAAIAGASALVARLLLRTKFRLRRPAALKIDLIAQANYFGDTKLRTFTTEDYVFDPARVALLITDAWRPAPHDMRHFTRLFIGDEWNHHLYSAILQGFTDLPCVLCAEDDAADRAHAALSVKRNGHRRSSLGEWYVRAAGLLSRDGDAFLLDTYLSLRDEMRVQLRLGQLPQRWRAVSPIEATVDASQRRWVVRGDSRSEFERCARTLIPLQMPSLYLEGRRRLVEQIDQLPWPRRPKVIWTSTAEIADDVFKAWAADKVERGAPLVISQHGGHYGAGLWSFHEDHEVAISNRYLSWGWSDPTRPEIKPVGQLPSRQPLGVRHAAQSRALLMTVATPRYSYWMYSFMVARQWLDYFEDQSTFVGNLSASVRNSLTVRLYPHDYGWGQRDRWADRYPDVRLDTGHSPMADLVKQSRLYISTYNATSFLESFRMDVPTVIYWNPCRWELRDSAVSYFEDLKRVGILHDTPAGAAHHASAIWDDVDAWWTGSDVRETLGRFKARYCGFPDDLLGRLETNLREVMLDRPGAIRHHA